MVDQIQKPEYLIAHENQESSQPGVRRRWIAFAMSASLALIAFVVAGISEHRRNQKRFLANGQTIRVSLFHRNQAHGDSLFPATRATAVMW